MAGTVQTVARKTEKGWQFADKHWYCADCGFVSSLDVQKEEAKAETGICRCGQEISKTCF